MKKLNTIIYNHILIKETIPQNKFIGKMIGFIKDLILKPVSILKINSVNQEFLIVHFPEIVQELVLKVADQKSKRKLLRKKYCLK